MCNGHPTPAGPQRGGGNSELDNLRQTRYADGGVKLEGQTELLRKVRQGVDSLFKAKRKTKIDFFSWDDEYLFLGRP